MIINKYRVHEVAKDFDIKSNKVVDLLAEYFDGQKKHMTALEEDELDLIFETFTKEKEVADLNDYFNFAPAGKEKAKQEKAPAEQAQEAPAEEKKEEKLQKEAAPQAEKKPAQKPAAPAKKDGKAEKAEKKPAPQQAQKPGKLPPMPSKKPQPKDEKPKENKPMQSRTKGEMRTIDTRAGNVDLEKYNERYENIAPTDKTKRRFRQEAEDKAEEPAIQKAGRNALLKA